MKTNQNTLPTEFEPEMITLRKDDVYSVADAARKIIEYVEDYIETHKEKTGLILNKDVRYNREVTADLANFKKSIENLKI